jgi:hypothetical protein
LLSSAYILNCSEETQNLWRRGNKLAHSA